MRIRESNILELNPILSSSTLRSAFGPIFIFFPSCLLPPSGLTSAQYSESKASIFPSHLLLPHPLHGAPTQTKSQRHPSPSNLCFSLSTFLFLFPISFPFLLVQKFQAQLRWSYCSKSNEDRGGITGEKSCWVADFYICCSCCGVLRPQHRDIAAATPLRCGLAMWFCFTLQLRPIAVALTTASALLRPHQAMRSAF